MRAALFLVPLLTACSTSFTTSADRPRAAERKPVDEVVRAWLQDVTGGRGINELAECTGNDDLLTGKPSSPAPDGSDTPAEWGGRRAVHDVAAAVEKIRRLQFRHPVRPKFLAAKDFTYRFADPLLSWTASDAFALHGRLLSALGAAPSSMDLQQISHRVTSEGLEGLYIPASEKLLVRTSDERGLSPRTRFVLAHELNHALVHQRDLLGLAATSLHDQDAGLARLAVIEGDATLTMHRYASHALSTADRMSILRNRSHPHNPTADLRDLPHYLQRQGSFPYDRGLEFVCELLGDGGWKAVDAAHRNPPTESAQVLFPSRYRSGEEGGDPRDLAGLPAPWRLVVDDVFGAANLLWLFEAPSGDEARSLDHSLDRAAAWSGGELNAWTKRGAIAVGLALVQRAGNRSLCRSMRAWYRASFPGVTSVKTRPGEVLAVDGGMQDAVIRCGGRDVRVGIAPTLSEARVLAR
ncbi:MAG: hypothetical protein M3N53_10250 [Actinomycetota bacterium]|nr:hypothetical protein [Actinomycetota bacterium]